jgi:hypothetical protein
VAIVLLLGADLAFAGIPGEGRTGLAHFAPFAHLTQFIIGAAIIGGQGTVISGERGGCESPYDESSRSGDWHASLA